MLFWAFAASGEKIRIDAENEVEAYVRAFARWKEHGVVADPEQIEVAPIDERKLFACNPFQRG